MHTQHLHEAAGSYSLVGLLPVCARLQRRQCAALQEALLRSIAVQVYWETYKVLYSVFLMLNSVIIDRLLFVIYSKQHMAASFCINCSAQDV